MRRLLIRAVLVVTSLLLVGPLCPPRVAGAELLGSSLSGRQRGLCEMSEAAAVLDPDAATACYPSDLLAFAPSVKQPDGEDSSAAFTASVAPTPPETPPMLGNVVVAPASSIVAAAPATGPGTPTYHVEDNLDVRRFLDRFQTGYRRAIVERWLVRAGRYLPMLLDVFKQKGLPEELVFTAMIESGFDPLAVSRVGAKGLWQFMAPTARRYGLRVDNWLDERLDPEKSTVAAARHFVDLYAVFGSWNLAQAAYNAGERTVLEAIRAMGTSDFWTLSRGRWLKEETKNFIPAIKAATLIAREPERYGFIVTPADPLMYELVSVPRSTNLRQLAAKSGIELGALERLNPELRLKQTPPDSAYLLKVPLGGAERVSAALEREVGGRQFFLMPGNAVEHRTKLRLTVPAGQPALVHVVKRQDTLTSIAKHYGVSVGDIVRWNDLGDTARITPGTRLRIATLPAREEVQGGSR
jgi:hypothetical protein